MDSFEMCWQFTLEQEGGFNPDETGGGRTMWGITEPVARAWGYQGDMRNLSQETAKNIARKEYFDRYQCGQLPAPFALLVFDTAYNGGKPVKWLQESIGTDADGVIGAKMIQAARMADMARTVALFASKRLRYMQSLKNFKENSGGWTLRICSLIEKGVG